MGLKLKLQKMFQLLDLQKHLNLVDLYNVF